MDLPPHFLEEIRALNWLAVHRDFWGSLFEDISGFIYASAISPGDTVADCGVNIGDHTLVMARCATEKGKVYAFEAAPEMMARAKGRLGGKAGVTWVEKAVWEKPDEVFTFHFYPDKDGLSSLRERDDSGESVKVDVTSTTLDATIAEPATLIKMDIEGAEYHALKGAERLMREALPVIIFENGREESAKRFGYTRDDFFNLFYSRGYALYSIVGLPFTPQLWEDVVMPWQFIAVHPGSPRGARALAAANQYMLNLQGGLKGFGEIGRYA